MSLNPYTVRLLCRLDGQRIERVSEVWAPTPTIAARENRRAVAFEMGMPPSIFDVAGVYEGHEVFLPEDVYDFYLDTEGYEMETRRRDVALFMADNPDDPVPGATQDASGIRIKNLDEAYVYVRAAQEVARRAEEV